MNKIKPSFKQRFIYGLDKFKMKSYIKQTYSFKPTPLDIKGPFIVAASRITSADQYLIMLSFKEYIYFTFNEGVYRTNPEIAKKQDFYGNIPYKIGYPIESYKDKLVGLVKDGNNLCIYPEMYTNYSGVTSPIDPSVAQMIKDAGCTLVTYCFTGGYFTEPAWAKEKRKGWINGHIVNVYSKYDLEKLTNAQITNILEEDLKEDAYARQCNSPITYASDHLAEGIENIFYLCPKCGEYDSFASSGKDYNCTKCDVRGSYTDQGLIHANFRFKTVTDFIKWEETQVDRIADSDINFNDENISLSKINDDHTLKLITTDKMHVDKDGISVGYHTFSFNDIQKVEVDDKATTLVFSHNNDYYKLSGPNFKPLKYRKLFYKRKEAIRLYGLGPK